MKLALRAFEIDCGRFPTTTESLAALVERPATVGQEQWRGPYLEEAAKDRWGKPFNYCFPGQHNTNSYDIWSCGLDGVSQSIGSDPDDINDWDGTKPWREYYDSSEQRRELVRLIYIVGQFAVPTALIWWLISHAPRKRDAD